MPDSTAGVRSISSSDRSGRNRAREDRSGTPESSVGMRDDGEVQFQLVESVARGLADERDAVGERIDARRGGAPPVSPMMSARCAARVSSLSPLPAMRIGTSAACSFMCSVTWRSHVDAFARRRVRQFGLLELLLDVARAEAEVEPAAAEVAQRGDVTRQQRGPVEARR